MTRRERLLRTLRGQPVDRPAVSFYELDGVSQNPDDPDPFNIFSDPSWRPLLELTRAATDLIVMQPVPFVDADDPLAERRQRREWLDDNGARHVEITLRAADRTFTARTRRDRDVFTVWTTEHLLKTPDDLRAWVDLPEPTNVGRPDVEPALPVERRLGDDGVIMIDVADPLCYVADLFEMGRYTMVALRERELMHAALEKMQRVILPRVRAIAAALPGRLWRIVGPEYAAPPYLPPRLFGEYVTRYVTPMVAAIHETGGYARVHSHGRLRAILDDIAATGCDGLDPIEPPPQGDVELAEVRERYGAQMVLFGNLEIADIEQAPTDAFREEVRRALDEGTRGVGRGFVLMPSACPYGRKLAAQTLRNYESIIEEVRSLE